MSQTELSVARRTHRASPRFKVGDMVRFQYVVGQLCGKVIEDRGPLAGGGVHIYRILVESPDVRRELELSADMLSKAG